MDVKFYSLSSLPTANSGAEGSFVHVTTGDNAGMWFCTGAAMIRLDNIAQDKAGEVKTATVDTATGTASFKNAAGTEVFTLALADYLAAEVAKLSGSATIASAADGVVTIKAGVSETNGKIENAVGTDIVLAKAATTGKAVDIILDPSAVIGESTNTTVQAAIEALISAFNGLVTDTDAAVKAHADNTTVHITADERTAWAGEVGAKAAAEAAQADATSALDAIGDAEGGLVKDIADNKAAAKAAQDDATAALDAIGDDTKGLVKGLADEVKRAGDAEDALDARVKALEDDSADADALAAEVKRAGDAEKALADRLDVIEGEGAGSIKKAAADAVAEVVAGADSDFDTLKEVADWIAADKTNSAALQATVAKLDGADTVEGSVAKAEKDAKAYADSLASNYDEAGAADTAEANAKAYADGLADNYDAAGAADTAEANAKAYADGLADNYDKAGDAAKALQDAKDYADGLADDYAAADHNHDDAYDAKGAAADAETAAKAYADTLVKDEDGNSLFDAAGDAAKAKSDVIGTAADTKDSDTVNGAKKYADAAVEAAKLVWLTEWPNA